ncbi:ariadne-2 [Pyrenophora seminiperda CCB06]|uniref:Ariadne-2 n=1 Tax=Pyrenophora seminiperda CCB06 TaxID=1302712 RepID=A0A3M7M426_9PLEO|nr:ariadne-2 [Pyrenophora seminiperda CCB06]
MNSAHDLEDDLTRHIAGASVVFNTIGQVIKVCLPSDFSVACITGFEPETTPETLANILKALGFDAPVERIKILASTGQTPEAKALVKLEDPLFSSKLSRVLQATSSYLCATTVPINRAATNCRKVYISWYKSSRSVWLNFGNADVAKRVSEKFNSANYKVLGQHLIASEPKYSPTPSGVYGGRNPKAWTVVLNNVSPQAKKNDIEKAILALPDKPRHIEMGHMSYEASEAEVSVDIRLKLEEYGSLEAFFLAPFSSGKRIKASVWFHDEAEARSACHLNNKPLSILNGGNLTVALVRSVKIKVLSAIYSTLESTIGQKISQWKEKHIIFKVYQDSESRFTTMKLEGGDTVAVGTAREQLQKITNGEILTNTDEPLWIPSLNSHGSVFQAVKALEKELSVVIIVDKVKRQLRFYGPPEKLGTAARKVKDIFKNTQSTGYEIELSMEQFDWVLKGGFKIMQQTLGYGTPAFNVVTRRVNINGTEQQYRSALALINRKDDLRTAEQAGLALQGHCPICFCEAENPVITSCEHTYCLECFEENCKAAASAAGSETEIKCQGDEGGCLSIFGMEEVRALLSSSAFENILEASFEAHVKRNPMSFHYCPTPNCDYIYRCSTASNLQPTTCSKCLEPVCTTCHASHAPYTCAEYKDIASGGQEALEKLKKELNIKDCPKCSTPMEKTEGCNHMTCGYCGAHICWVCMAVFKAPRP